VYFLPLEQEQCHASSAVAADDLTVRTFILLTEFRMQHYNSKITEYTIQYMHTWILKDECVATYIAPIKQKMHLINTMSVHGII